MSEEVNLWAFPKFNNLPIELRHSVWEFALPEDIPEICIPWPLEEGPGNRSHDLIPLVRSNYLHPFLVDTCFPTIMYVCQESRYLAISRLRFRYSHVAGCPVPFRAFRPDLDTVYITLCRPPTDIITIPRWGRYPPGTQHVALDLHTIKDGSYLWVLLSDPTLDLRTMSCILPASEAILDTAVRFRPPFRRCRFREVKRPSNGSENNIIYVDRGYDRRMTGMGRYLEEVRDTISTEFSEIFERQEVPEEYLRRWNEEEVKFDVKLLAKTFEEYRGGRWVPSSEHPARFDSQSIIFPASWEALGNATTYQVSELERWTPLRNPETFRVNDIQQNEVPFELF
ncbi:hypothetical protein F5Y11DRAFT_295875 [Daldinia sp. FL1419]|nr:hypothetical protein F5Y11DRAFT_295875 [Daldinia sp. FL1419]